MNLRLASVRIPSGLDCVDSAVQSLEDEWLKRGDVHLESFWAEQNRTRAVGPVESMGVLAELVKTDLRRRFDAGQRPTIAGYLERFPELRGADSRVLSLVYEEFCLCEEFDGGADVESFCDRYPDWKSSLQSQLCYHRMISQAAGATPALPRFPKSGEKFEEFELLSRLGKGGTSRVFLARDLSLGGKHVALKVTLDRGQEPKIQGPLQHPHIVPVNSVTYQTEGRLCGLSMPYQPGLPLDEIIKRVKPSGRPGRAMALWSVLLDGPNGIVSPGSEVIPTDGVNSSPRGDGWKGFPERGSYTQGVAWIAMVLARALHYAHGKQIYHCDVKPANILLTINHGPQLLDFNLAESPHSPDDVRAALHGGTLPYMAPEQIAAFLNPELWPRVGAGADIYSLGLVLRELLTGQMPDLPKAGLPAPRAMSDLLDRRHFLDVAVRRFNPSIPPSLEAIVAKCLAFSPSDRYADAESLARDLERFLNHQPLLKAGNPSRRERLGNCWKRHRRAFKRAGIVGVLVLIFGAALVPTINEWLTPSYKSLPSFQTAVECVHEGELERARDLLSGIVESYPRAPLAKIYYAFALDTGSDMLYEADDHMRGALAFPGVDEAVLAWAAICPEFFSLFVEFVQARINRADAFAQTYDVDEAGADHRRDKELRKPTYDLAKKALALAEKLDPRSDTVQQLLAKTEQIYGDYDGSHARLDRLIDSLQGDKKSSIMALFYSHKLRGRVAFLGIEKKRSQGNRVSEAFERDLNAALTDLKFCDSCFIRGLHSLNDRMQYDVWHDQARARLTLAEVQIDLEKATEADRHLDMASKLIEQMQAYHSNDGNLPNPTSLIKRLAGLRTPGGIASSRPRQQTPGRS